MRTAEKACAKYREAIKPPEMSDEEKRGVQAGGARERALHARARHRHARPDVRRERRRADPDRPGSGIDPERPEVPEGAGGVPRHAADGRQTTRARTSDEARWPAARRSPPRLVAAGALRRRRRRSAARPRSRPPARATATVERRDLVDRENLVRARSATPTPARSPAGVAGTLTGAARARRASSPAATRCTPSTASRRRSCSTASCRPGATSRPGMTDGEDVRQLERNLRALGHDPGHGRRRLGLRTRPRPSSASSAARELDDDGTLARGEIVFRPGATRIGEAKARGRRPGLARAGRWPRSPRPSGVVTVALDARRQQLARARATA